MQTQHQWYRDDDTGQYVFDVSVVVHAPVHKCFTYWSNFESFPQMMTHITRVTRIGENTWHWEATVAGRYVAWDAVTSEYRRNEIIGWVSIHGQRNAGTVRFDASGVQHCRVSVHLLYDPPFGMLGDFFARRGVNNQLHRDLHDDMQAFKHAVEAGEAEQFRRRAA